jgi:pimeloyl-ACP methyl ester carboxylesterase
MSQQVQPIGADAFFASLRDRTAKGVQTVALDGGELPVSVRLRRSPYLVLSFNGAVDRGKHQLPRFAATGIHSYTRASIVALSDPSLARSESLSMAWYAGHEGFELQKILPDFIRRMIESLRASRVVFVGGSGGGFAALYYSWHFPGSVALVSNPQTDLDRYNSYHLKTYRTACWPSLEADAPLSSAITTNLCPLYAERVENALIYFQIANDWGHLTRHFAPFVAGLPREHADHLIARVATWGKKGHRPVPANIWVPWLTAALAAPEPTAKAIEETWAAANPLQLPALSPLIPRINRDEQIADALASEANQALLGPRSESRRQQ